MMGIDYYSWHGHRTGTRFLSVLSTRRVCGWHKERHTSVSRRRQTGRQAGHKKQIHWSGDDKSLWGPPVKYSLTHQSQEVVEGRKLLLIWYINVDLIPFIWSTPKTRTFTSFKERESDRAERRRAKSAQSLVVHSYWLTAEPCLERIWVNGRFIIINIETLYVWYTPPHSLIISHFLCLSPSLFSGGPLHHLRESKRKVSN